MNSFRFKNNSHFIIILILGILCCSCGSRKELVYFQDEPVSQDSSVFTDYEIRYKADDLVTIDVSALDPDAARPFNLPLITFDPSVRNAQGNLRVQSYLVDINGNIDFPVLGTIKLAGLSRTEATNLFKEKLKEYIKNPIVNIRLTNFTISVLGEVNSPGTFTIQDERITVPEALGLAGDLTIYGKRENVFLIREIEGQKKYAKIDLTSINMVNTPTYYLTQNDVLYVEPNKARIRQSSFNQNNAIVISAVGTLATIIAILIR